MIIQFRTTTFALILFICAAQFFLTSPHILAQTPQTAPIEKAFELFQSGRVEEAVNAFESITKAEPQNGRAWYGLGLSFYSQGQYGKSVEAFRKAENLQFNRAGVTFLTARAYAKSGDKDKAFEWLNKAVDVGFGNIELVETDSDLDSLRDDSRYKTVVARFKAAATPCKARPEYRAFDFFIGEWEQQTQAGRVVGTTSVKLTLESCVIEETSVNPQSKYTGRAFHYFDPALGKWRQTYVATKADFSLWTGDFKDGEIRYTGEISNPNGSKSLGRNTFTRVDANRIRQLFEISTDGGKSWTTNWDGFYVRKNPVN